MNDIKLKVITPFSNFNFKGATVRKRYFGQIVLILGVGVWVEGLEGKRTCITLPGSWSTSMPSSIHKCNACLVNLGGFRVGGWCGVEG